MAVQKERDAALTQLAEAQEEAAALRSRPASASKGINGSPEVCMPAAWHCCGTGDGGHSKEVHCTLQGSGSAGSNSMTSRPAEQVTVLHAEGGTCMPDCRVLEKAHNAV